MPVEFDGFQFDSESAGSADLGAVAASARSSTLAPANADPLLDVEFFNANHLAGPPPAATPSPAACASAPGPTPVVRVTSGRAGPDVLRLRVEPIGDYSVYAARAAGDFDRCSAAPFSSALLQSQLRAGLGRPGCAG
jgi:hypothetical protein